ncbi:MAG TPA: tetratricopeptide repeat protein [Pseudomonadales bacterium]|nr:tetratricopeptide repeat protein [Pseudomonadales bacterium]
MDKYLKPLAMAIALTTGTTAWAAGADDLASLRNRVAAGDKQAAWQQAQQMRPQYESDPAFDYLYGTLALGQQRYSEAQFSLERVLIADPGNLSARLALGEAYYKLGDQASAKKQFDLIKQSNPPADILREVNRYVGATAGSQAGRLMGFVEATVGYDNNINQTSSSDTIANPAYDPIFNPFVPTTITISPGARRQTDMFNSEQMGLDYYQPFDETTGMELRGRANYRNNLSSDNLDASSYRASGSVYKLMGRHTFRGTLSLADNQLSDSEYFQTHSLSADWLGHDYGGWDLFANVFVNDLQFDDDLRDMRQYIAQGGGMIQVGDFKHTAGVLVGNEHALNSGASYNANQMAGVFYDTRYFLNSQHQLFGRVFLEKTEQKGTEPFFIGQSRDATLQQLSAGWDWQLTRPVRLRSEVGYSRHDSDIGFYTYDRSWIQTSIRYSF